MNRINTKLQTKGKLLSIYFTAGFPNLDDTVKIIKQLENADVDMIEIGLPFSDPLADGPTIQRSSTKALQNGMSTDVLFEQLKNIRDVVKIPLLIMGYFNPILQYGVERFCQKCAEIGIDGTIIPDLPLDVFQEEYQELFDKYGLINTFLITPQTSEKRIEQIDDASNGFIYMVSSASVTGGSNTFEREQIEYFERIEAMNLSSPQIIGFGIHDRETFETAVNYANGAIIGSAFIKVLESNGLNEIDKFIGMIRPK